MTWLLIWALGVPYYYLWRIDVEQMRKDLKATSLETYCARVTIAWCWPIVLFLIYCNWILGV
jgi:hypothetical protein